MAATLKYVEPPCARRFAVAILANDSRNSCNLISVLRVPSVSRTQPIIHPSIGLIGFPERGNDWGGDQTWASPFFLFFALVWLSSLQDFSAAYRLSSDLRLTKFAILPL